MKKVRWHRLYHIRREAMGRASEPKWQDSFYAKGYALAAEGLDDEDIAKAFGVPRMILLKWKARKPAFKDAIKQGRSVKGGARKLKEMAFARMPDAAKDLWERLEMAEDIPKDDRAGRRQAIAQVQELIDMGTLRVRQHLFLHALLSSDFMPSIASQRTGIPTTEYEGWKEEDAFAKMVKALYDAKKDFYESHLVQLVRNGDSAATIFANKTLNRDRGYGTDTKTVNFGGTVEHDHKIKLEDIPLEARRMMIAAFQARKEQEQLAHKDLIDLGPR
jgi:hypothetical protein